MPTKQKKKKAPRKPAKVCRPKRTPPGKRRRRGSITVTVHPSRKFLKPALEKMAVAAASGLQAALKKAADRIPDNIRGGNFGEVRGESYIRPGRYIMRNGSSAIVVEPVTLKFGVQMRQTWQGWKGHLEDYPHGEGLTWGLDGKRSDATPAHEHDLGKRHKNQSYSCSGCGCTDDRACPGGCSWVAPTRCSACFPLVT